MKSVYFVSLGCPKNLVDSELALGFLDEAGFTLARSPALAEVIVINTCSFIHDAKKESVETILELSEFKEKGKCRLLVVTGCLPQGYVQELEKELPEVDLFLGTSEYERIAELIAEAFNKKANKRKSVIKPPVALYSERAPRVHTGPSYLGYLKISEGCNRHCSFCIIPRIRGSLRSRKIGSLVKEAKQMAEAGVKELNLVAQDLTEFGLDQRRKGLKEQKLENLLTELVKINGIQWIRLHYVYPDDFSDQLVETIAREKKIVKYLDIPLQHTNDRILRAMNRKLRKRQIFSLVRKLRKRIPNITLRASIIVGFPTETKAEFKELCEDLRKLRLDRVGVFTYSKEEQTKAAELEPQISQREKKRRERVLLKIIEKTSFTKQKALKGKEIEVLIEGESEETDFLIQARMSSQSVGIDGHVLINDAEDLTKLGQIKQGDFARVRITEVLSHDLIGKLI